MLLQGIADFLYVDFRLIVAAFHQLQFVTLLFEEAQKTFGLLFVKAFQFSHHIHNQVADLSQILGADIGQGGIGEVRHFLLGDCTILKHLVGVFQIDFGGKVRHHLLLLGGQHRLGYGSLHGGGFFLGGKLDFFQLRFQSQGGN